MSSTAGLDASKLVVTKTDTPSDYSTFGLGKLADHMAVIDYTQKAGWHTPTIIPTKDFKLTDPSSVGLQYAVTCFEGMKAYKGKDDKVRLFRPLVNFERLNNSSARIALPAFDGGELLKIFDVWLNLEKDFVPSEGMVYVRPTHFGTTPSLDGAEHSSRLFCYVTTISRAVDYDSDFKPYKLLANNYNEQVRAWPGGFGNHKLGANYGPTAATEIKAFKSGFNSTFWLYGEKNIVTEAGSSNFFAVWLNDEGVKEVVTCPLSSGLILPGVTRRSLLTLLEKKTDYVVKEQEFSTDDLISKWKAGKLVEAFACGTYVMVTPVGQIQAPNGEVIEFPVEIDNRWGKLTKELYNELKAIQWGEVDHEWSHVCG